MEETSPGLLGALAAAAAALGLPGEGRRKLPLMGEKGLGYLGLFPLSLGDIFGEGFITWCLCLVYDLQETV